MSKPNNEMIIHLTSGDKLRLHRVAEPQTDAEPVVFQMVWQSLRTTYHLPISITIRPRRSAPRVIQQSCLTRRGRCPLPYHCKVSRRAMPR